jgi:hypothetical protein
MVAVVAVPRRPSNLRYRCELAQASPRSESFLPEGSTVAALISQPFMVSVAAARAELETFVIVGISTDASVGPNQPTPRRSTVAAVI